MLMVFVLGLLSCKCVGLLFGSFLFYSKRMSNTVEIHCSHKFKIELLFYLPNQSNNAKREKGGVENSKL